MKKMMKNEKGFTLIELIIVIAILAIIAAVAVPNILGAVDNSRRSTDVANAKIILNAAAQVQAKSTNVTPETAAITKDNLVDSSPSAFEQALYSELNGTIPEPKYQGANFDLVVSGTTMKVTVTVGSTTYEVAPNADSDSYNPQ